MAGHGPHLWLTMACRKCHSVLVTGSNQGIGLELVRQLVDSPSGQVRIFASCRDPNGPRAQVGRMSNMFSCVVLFVVKFCFCIMYFICSQNNMINVHVILTFVKVIVFTFVKNVLVSQRKHR